MLMFAKIISAIPALLLTKSYSMLQKYDLLTY